MRQPTIVYYQRLARCIKRAGKMVPPGGREAEFQTALEYDLRRAGIPFASQEEWGSGREEDGGGGSRVDLVVGSFGVELKVERSTVMPVVDAAAQARRYLETAPEGIDSIVIAILHLVSRTVHLTQALRRGGTQLVLRPNGVHPRNTPDNALALQPHTPDIVLTPAQVVQMQRPMTLEDYQALKGEVAGVRDLLITQVLFNTGLRINEVLRLTAAHVGEEGPDTYLAVRRAKKMGKTPFAKIYLRRDLGLHLREWVKVYGGDATAPLFGIKARQYRNVFYAASERAFGFRRNPHQLRELHEYWITHEAEMPAKKGIPIETAANLLGHDSIETTRLHYHKLRDAENQAIHQQMPV